MDVLPKKTTLEKPVSWKDRLAAFFGLSGNLPEAVFESPAETPTMTRPVIYDSEGSSLLIRIYKRKDFGRTLKTAVYLFGYSHKNPFALMPKIFIITKYTRFKVLDGAREIPGRGVALEMKPEELTIKIPFTLLGNPDFILASVRGNFGASHVDTLSFRKINLRRK